MASVRRIGLALAIGAGVFALLGIVAITFLNTEFAHRFLLKIVTERMQSALNEPVEIERLSFHHWRLGADFYGITIHGSQPSEGLPFFTAARVAIDVRLHLLGKRKLEIEDLTLDHPVMHLSITSNGTSNLPHPSSRGASSQVTVFDAAIGHFVLTDGEILYGDRRIPVTADIQDLNAQAAYNAVAKSYDASLSYRDATVRYGTIKPFAHELQISLTAGPSALELKSLLFRTGSSWIRAQGQLTNYSAPSVTGTYQVSLSTAECANLFESAAISSPGSVNGRIDTSGSISYRDSGSRQAIDNFTMSGAYESRSLAIKSPSLRLVVQSLKGDYVLDRGVLEVHKLDADLLGGHVSGHLLVSDLSGKAAARLEAQVASVSLSDLQEAIQVDTPNDVRVRGRMDGNARASWIGGMKHVRLDSKAMVNGTIASDSSAQDPSQSFPVQANMQASYDGDKRVVTLQNCDLSTTRSHLAAAGSLGSSADLKVDARSDDLHEVGFMVLAFQPKTSASQENASLTTHLATLTGQGEFRGTVSGSLANPEIAGSLDARNVQIGSTSLTSLRTAIQVSSAGIGAHQGELRIGSQPRIDFDVSVGLQNWHFTPDQPVAVRLSANRISAADLENVTGLRYPVSGTITANLNLRGTERNPGIQGNVRLTQANLWQQPVQNLAIDLKNAENVLQATCSVQTLAGSANGTLRYDFKNTTYDVSATSTDLQLNKIEYLQEHSQKVAGIVRASIQGHGDLKSPQLDARIESSQLRFGTQKIDGLTAQASIAQQRATFDVGASVSGATLQSRGTVDLTGDYQATATVDSQVIQLDSLLGTFLPRAASELRGTAQFHGTLKGPLKKPDRLEAHIEVPSFEIGYSSLQLSTAGPILIDYQQGVLAVKRAEFRGTGTDLAFEARLPLQGSQDLTATANGSVNLQLLQMLDSQWQSSGVLNLRIGAQGSRLHPNISGTIAVSNGSFSASSDMPTLEKLEGELDVTGERIQVKSLTGQLAGGDLEVGGFATYRPNVQYNFFMKARKVRLLYPEGMRTQLTANVNFTGKPSNSNLTGQITIDRLSLTQSFDLASFASAFSAPSTPSTGMAQNIKLNIALTSSETLQLASSQVSVEGTADLRLQGTLGNPVVIGRTNLTGGEVFFNSKRFQIQNAAIQFVNPVHTEPVVNLTATTTVNEFNLTINLVGPLDRLRTSYTSDPPLPPLDVINLLITGQTTEAAQASSTSPLSVLAGQLGGQASSRLQKLTGISSLTIDPQIGGNQGNGANQLAIQERVTKNLFFTFATDVTTTQGQVVQVEYQVTRKYSMSAVRDQSGGYEIQIKAHKTF